jgi:hypothetical protein
MYIAEAHATDEWPVLSVNPDIRQHQTALDRHEATVKYLNTFPLSTNYEILLDNESNEFNNSYSSWPTRYWIIMNGKVCLKMMPDVDKISLDDLKRWLYAAYEVNEVA